MRRTWIIPKDQQNELEEYFSENGYRPTEVSVTSRFYTPGGGPVITWVDKESTSARQSASTRYLFCAQLRTPQEGYEEEMIWPISELQYQWVVERCDLPPVNIVVHTFEHSMYHNHVVYVQRIWRDIDDGWRILTVDYPGGDASKFKSKITDKLKEVSCNFKILDYHNQWIEANGKVDAIEKLSSVVGSIARVTRSSVFGANPPAHIVNWANSMARIFADNDEWPALMDPERSVSGPIYALIYHDGRTLAATPCFDDSFDLYQISSLGNGPVMKAGQYYGHLGSLEDIDEPIAIIRTGID